MTRQLTDGMMRHVDARGEPLEAYDLEDDEIVAGTPTTAEVSVTTIGDVEVGIWQITPGTVRDVEKDEVFVVLEGDGTIRFADGEVVGLGPGSLVRLHAGEVTEWEIRQTLRKVYVV
jgi:uncharacterized protein